MQLKTILNRIHKHKSFVYGADRLYERGGRLRLDVGLVANHCECVAPTSRGPDRCCPPFDKDSTRSDERLTSLLSGAVATAWGNRAGP